MAFAYLFLASLILQVLLLPWRVLWYACQRCLDFEREAEAEALTRFAGTISWSRARCCCCS
jgi:hypothetical protein